MTRMGAPPKPPWLRRRNLNVRLEGRMLDALDAEAAARGVSRTVAVEKALVAWLTDEGRPVPTPEEV